MTENFLFKAIFISLAVHTAFLWGTYLHRINDRQYKAMRQNRVEISYKPNYRRPADIHEYPIRPAQHLDFINDPKLFSDGTIPVSLVKEKAALPFEMYYERKPEQMRNMELSSKVSITQIKSEKINNPVYSAYFEMARARIEEKIYANYDNLERGYVYLTFLIDEHGMLKAARIVEEKSDASDHLKEIAMRSLQEASPFPHFFKGMNLSEYSCNIGIQYQVSD